MTKKIKNIIKDHLRKRGVFVLRRLPLGVDIAYDIQRFLPRNCVSVIFDVGANVGQSTEAFLKDFSGAKIYSFEPSSKLFRRLESKFANHPRVLCFNIGFSSTPGSAELDHTSAETMYHIKREKPPEFEVIGGEKVYLDTIDKFCSQSKISHIDFLKIDTEGYDQEVLLGATEMMKESRVCCLQAECSLSPENKFHADFFDICALLFQLKYRLFGIYEQVPSWNRRAPDIRRVNAAFISSRVIDLNSGSQVRT
jgi:FkbM family methyltransferase